MSQYAISDADRLFLANFESGTLAPTEFNHYAHVRLAYVCLAEGDLESSADRMKQGLLCFLKHHGVPAEKYHETLTRAWLMAVRHFMNISGGALSAEAFINANPVLLDSKIMLTHYSADLLFSPEARHRFVEPDIQRIPPEQ